MWKRLCTEEEEDLLLSSGWEEWLLDGLSGGEVEEEAVEWSKLPDEPRMGGTVAALRWSGSGRVGGDGLGRLGRAAEMYDEDAEVAAMGTEGVKRGWRLFGVPDRVTACCNGRDGEGDRPRFCIWWLEDARGRGLDWSLPLPPLVGEMRFGEAP